MIDPTKKYKTRLNREVRIYAVDGGGEYPVHGAILKPDGIWDSQCWEENGSWCSSSDDDIYDLIEVRPRIKREVWVNVYTHQLDCSAYYSREYADRYATGDRIACVKIMIDCEEGEGL